MDSLFAQSRLLWKPVDPRNTRLDAFRRMVNRKRGMKLRDYDDLHRYSVEDYAFWEDLWQFLCIVYSVPPEKVITEGRYKEIPRWFPGARLNYAENVLCHDGDLIACTAAREDGAVEHYSHRQLKSMVKEMAAALSVNGLQAAVVTNHIDAIVIALATLSIGGIYSSTAPDMGTQGILDRYTQIRPKFFFTETEVLYAGKTIDLRPKVSDVVQGLASCGLQRVVLLPSAVTRKNLAISPSLPFSMTLAAFLATGDGRELTYAQLPFDHPVFILYSSGTTGPPKCIVHSAGGVLIQGKKAAVLSYGMNTDHTYFQYTTAGWMMWNAMLTTLSSGSRIILYDGSPFHPDVRTFLRFISEQGVTLLGTGPRFLAEIQGRGIEPLKLAPFESLRIIFSTGAVLTPPMFEWTQKAFGEHIMIASGSGGTDICSGFIEAPPTMPIYAGETPAKCLGMKIEIFDPEGRNIEDTGMPGELVCTRPHPSLPIGFWGDESGERLRKAYFETYPGIWRQGDFIVKNPRTKGLIMLGRSDGVLNPSGVRFGSAEIYSVMEQFNDIVDDTLCVGQRRPEDKDERVLLFVKMRPGHTLTPALDKKMREAIRKALSPRHVPAYIFQVEDIPYTVNNKKIEIAVKQIVSGSTLKPSGTVANPDSLKLYYKFRDLEKWVSNQHTISLKAKL